mmetsp:Transcript_68361/g.198031  ORF Transcript_68361/g.198031 Transcript_68361/m.198031 type:complete len:583 (-) Transcript_68361:13-1761(-)
MLEAMVPPRATAVEVPPTSGTAAAFAASLSAAAAPVGQTIRASGSCRCGAVRLSVPVAREVPWQVCHCPHCRRAHGASWAVLVAPVGGSSAVDCTARPGALRPGVESRCLGLGPDGACVRRSFCAFCCSTVSVTVTSPGRPRAIWIAAGILSNAGFPKDLEPSFIEIYTAQRAPYYPPSDVASVSDNTANGRKLVRLSGSCSCHACRFECGRWQGMLQHCHCGMCRQMSGAAFQTWAAVRANGLTWTARAPLRKLRTSSHACREVCMECGTALTILYDCQPRSVWLAAACFDRGAFPRGAHSGEAVHICIAYAPRWFTPDRWPEDGLNRIRGVFEGDKVPLFEDSWEVGSADIRKSFGRSSSSSAPPEPDDDEDDEVREAIRRSMLDSRAGRRARTASSDGAKDRADADDDDDDDDDADLRTALALSAAEAAAAPKGQLVAARLADEAVRAICEVTGRARLAAEEALRKCGGDANAAAAMLLASAEVSTSASSSGDGRGRVASSSSSSGSSAAASDAGLDAGPSGPGGKRPAPIEQDAVVAAGPARPADAVGPSASRGGRVWAKRIRGGSATICLSDSDAEG